jgi:hypothetical protein
MREIRSSGSVEGVMSNRDPYSDSVEFCFTLKTYLKGAPFYNASASPRSSFDFPQARLWTISQRGILSLAA